MHGRTPSSTTAPTPNFIELPVAAPYPAVENDDIQGVLEGSSKLSTDMPAFRYHGKCSTTALIHAVNDLIPHEKRIKVLALRSDYAFMHVELLRFVSFKMKDPTYRRVVQLRSWCI